MKIIKESIDRWFDYDLHVETRTIYIGDGEDSGVGPLMAEKVIKAFAIFNLTPEKPVRVILNTEGGHVSSGYAIYDAIKSSPCHVTIEVMGSASSMGSIILQAGDERIIHPSAIIMAHDGAETWPDPKHVRDLEAWSTFSREIDRPKMYEIFAKRTKKPASYWKKKCAHDYIMTADQALEEGMVDSIYGRDSDEDEETE